MPASSTGRPEQRPADHLRDVVVADRQGVGVAEGPLRRLGGGPHPDPRQRRQRVAGLLRRPRRQPLQRRRPAARSRRWCGPGPDRRWRGGTPTTGCDATPRPTAAPACRAGAGPGRRGAVLGHQQPPGPKRVGAGHPLLDHRGDQRLQHPVGAAQPQVRHPPVRRGDRRLRRGEIRRVVVGAQQRGQRVDEFLGAACPTPRSRRRRAAARLIRAVTGPVAQQAGPPDRAVSAIRKHGSPRTAAQRRQRVPGLTGAGERDRALTGSACVPTSTSSH